MAQEQKKTKLAASFARRNPQNNCRASRQRKLRRTEDATRAFAKRDKTLAIDGSPRHDFGKLDSSLNAKKGYESLPVKDTTLS